MNTNLKKPCAQCPFRRTSAPGYLGADKPENFVNTTLSDVRMPCHQTVDYEDPEWKLQVVAGAKVEQCAGSAIFYANQCKVSRDRESLRLPADRSLVFTNRSEFLEHHEHDPFDHRAEDA